MITFADFMRRATRTYYSGRRDGADFVTAPQVSPAFGHLIGRDLASMWRRAGEPGTFFAIECGAAGGQLARDVTAYLRTRDKPAARAIRYLTVDRTGGDVVADAMTWPFAQVVGCILSNELFDAFPVHRLVGTDRGFGELWVDDEELRVGPVSDDRLEAHVRELGIGLAAGQIVDVSLDAADAYRGFCRSLASGFILTIDYGGDAAELYGQTRRAGTVVAYHRHRVVEDALLRPGRQDLTAHVDFTTLRAVGERCGLQTVVYTRQREYLRALGLEEWCERLDPRHLSVADRFNAALRAHDLVRLDRLGKFRVLVQARL